MREVVRGLDVRELLGSLNLDVDLADETVGDTDGVVPLEVVIAGENDVLVSSLWVKSLSCFFFC